MFIQMPDPFPGRCQNYRTIGYETVRCLYYERKKHYCSFPDPPLKKNNNYYSSSTITSPTPWVSPLEKDEE